jgi:RNA polymerase sigma-70 factor (ECF subfamily)
MPTDEELVGRLAEGHEPALRELLERYERPLSSFLYRQTGGRDVEDLYQETWIRVTRHAASFDRSKRFSTWLFQIAVNLARDWHRMRAREDGRPVPVEDAAATNVARTEARIDARRLLEQLPEMQREVVILRYYHDLTEEEVAGVLECPKGTVKSRMHNALARLSELARRTKQ